MKRLAEKLGEHQGVRWMYGAAIDTGFYKDLDEALSDDFSSVIEKIGLKMKV